DCLRIRNVLRRGFKQSVIQVNDGTDLFRDGLLVVSAVDGPESIGEQTGDLHGKIQRAEFLLETAKALASPQELDQALWNVSEKSREILGDTAFVFLLERGEPELRCVVSTPADQLTRIMTALLNTGPLAKAKLQEVFESGRELLINHLSVLDLPQELKSLVNQFGFMSLMAAPIKKDG